MKSSCLFDARRRRLVVALSTSRNPSLLIFSSLKLQSKSDFSIGPLPLLPLTLPVQHCSFFYSKHLSTNLDHYDLARLKLV